MENTSLNSIEKLYFNNNNKSKFITKIKITKKNFQSFNFIIVDNIEENYKLESIKDFSNNKEEEFLEDSLKFSISEINSHKKINIEDKISWNQNDIKRDKRSSICNIIDIIKNNVGFKKLEKKLSLSFKNFEEIENNSVEESINLNEKKISNFLNILNKQLLIEYDCSICLNKFEENNEILIINNCLHIFHDICLEKWINVKELNNNNCPYCKENIS